MPVAAGVAGAADGNIGVSEGDVHQDDELIDRYPPIVVTVPPALRPGHLGCAQQARSNRKRDTDPRHQIRHGHPFQL